MRMRLSRERRFEVTPLDLLVIFVALALPNLPGLRGAPSNLGLSVAKLVVLFYAVEMLPVTRSGRARGCGGRGAGVSGGAGGAGVGGWRAYDTCHTTLSLIGGPYVFIDVLFTAQSS